jgi:hypothetical protein
MLFFLTSISAVLIALGGAAALYGADTIRSESGATIAVAGVSFACAGFLLLGLVQVCVELRRLRRLAEAQGNEPRAAALPPVPAFPVPVAVPAPDRPAGSVAEGKAEGAESVPSPALAEPVPVPPASDRKAAVASDLERDAEEAVDSDLLDAGDDHAPDLRDTGAASRPPKERGDPVATYTSGANTYFMFGDGTIEAETPKGRFRFATMAELRHYAETGEGGVLVKSAHDEEGQQDRAATRAETITI